VALVQQNYISIDEALGHATELEELKQMLGSTALKAPPLRSRRAPPHAEGVRTHGDVPLAGRVPEGRDAQRRDGGDEPRGRHRPPRTQRIQPIPAKIKEKGKGLDKDLKLPSFGAPVKSGDIVVFTRQFATMINAGLPILQCLQILGSQSESPPSFRKIIGQLKDDVESVIRSPTPAQASEGLHRPLHEPVQAGEIGGISTTILPASSVVLESRPS
jgi:hypothetical protein